MVYEKEWNEFRESGLLWFINTILHTFGWAIVYTMENGKILNVYPTRVKFRGFSEKSNTRGYKNLTKYMKENSEELLKEIEEE